MEQEIVLSVVIPVTRMSGKFGNLASWLEDSKLYPLQIIFVHDIQDNLTGSELQELIREKKILNCVQLEGTFGNPGMARNFGLRSIKGDWFSFWDADDLPNLQNVFSAIAQGTGYEILIGQFEVVNRDGETKRIEITKDLAGHLVKNPGLWRMIFKMDLNKKIQFPPIRMAEDQIALSGLQIFNLRVQLYDYVFYTYFQSFPGQLTSNKSAIDDLIKAVKISGSNLQYSSESNKRFDYGLHLKQILTGVKMGSLNTKITLIKNEMHFFTNGLGLSRSDWIKAFFWNIKIWWRNG